MKKTLIAFACAAMTCAMLTSCTVTTPVAATSNPVGNKCGEASFSQFLGFLGGSSNAGINKAAKNGGITKISHVDFVTKNSIFVKKYTVRVYGE